MKVKIVDGVTLFRRPCSSSCPKGAWFGKKHHTSWADGGWIVFETGKDEIGYYRTALEAQRLIAELETN